MSANSRYSPAIRSLPAGRHARKPDARPTDRTRSALAEAVGLLADWRERTRQRRALAELPAHLLHDIGIDRRMALLESAKPFWKP